MIDSNLDNDQINRTCLATTLYCQCSCTTQQHHDYTHDGQDEENAARLILIARFAADRSNDGVRTRYACATERPSMKWRAAACLIWMLICRSKTRVLIFHTFALEPFLCNVVLPIPGTRDGRVATRADSVQFTIDTHERPFDKTPLKIVGAETFVDGNRAHTPCCSTRRTRNAADRSILRRVCLQSAFIAAKPTRRRLRVACWACFTGRSGRVQKVSRRARPAIARTLPREISRGALFA